MVNNQFNRLWELSLTAKMRPGAEEILQNIFMQAGVGLDRLAELRKGQYVKLLTYATSFKELKILKRELGRQDLKKINVFTHSLSPRDWADKWKRNIKPFYLVDNIYLIPAWHQPKRIPSKAVPLVLDTTFAFGTGLHETTRFMAELIVRNQKRFTTFLDVGTGSGILSVIAAHCGAKMVIALDIDPECVKVAESNMKRNGYQFQKVCANDVFHCRLRKQYDFVAANLVSADLLTLAEKLISLVERGKYLAVSGILLENLSRVQKHYEAFPVRMIKKLSGKQWSALLFQKK